MFVAIAVADDGTAWKIRLNITDGEITTPWVQLPALPDRAKGKSMMDVL
ncbi:MAG: hypothetical protein KA735_15045 [Burkholderiaceae bacterium]|nr:hypothetical protein [Burkholderiaceae bacterium]